jgi:hypothetical protein
VNRIQVATVLGIAFGSGASLTLLLTWLRLTERRGRALARKGWDPAYRYFKSEVCRLRNQDAPEQDWLDAIDRYLRLDDAVIGSYDSED